MRMEDDKVIVSCRLMTRKATNHCHIRLCKHKFSKTNRRKFWVLTHVGLVAVLVRAGGILALEVAQLPLRVVIHVEHLQVRA